MGLGITISIKCLPNPRVDSSEDAKNALKGLQCSIGHHDQYVGEGRGERGAVMRDERFL